MLKVVMKCGQTKSNLTLDVKAAGYFVHVEKFKDSSLPIRALNHLVLLPARLVKTQDEP